MNYYWNILLFVAALKLGFQKNNHTSVETKGESGDSKAWE